LSVVKAQIVMILLNYFDYDPILVNFGDGLFLVVVLKLQALNI